MTGPGVPADGVIVVAVEALRSDARLWDRGAGELSAAAAAARGLALEPGAFSFLGQEAAGHYAEVQRQLARLLDDGAAAIGDIGATLRSCAEVYEAEERAGVHRLRGVW